MPKLVGGLRIKKIEDFDGINTAPVVRTFKYENTLVMRTFDPITEYITTIYDQAKVQTIFGGSGGTSAVCNYEMDGPASCFQEYLVRSAYAKTSLPSNPIGYGKVTVFNGPNGVNGRTVKEFSNIADDRSSGVVITPFPPATSNQWRRGTLLKEVQLNASLDTLTKTVFKYNDVISPTPMTYVKVAREYIYYTWYNDPDKINGLHTGFWTEIMGYQQLQTKTTTNYQGTNKLTVTENFFYDNPSNLRFTRTERTDSEGRTVKTNAYTAQEKSFIQSAFGSNFSSTGSSTVDVMITKNMLNQVLATEEFVGTTPTKKMLTNNKQVGSFIVADNVVIQIGSSAQESKVQFTQYDNCGNLIEEALPLNINHAFIWDYNCSLMIAEVVNASSSEIAYSSFEADGTGGWTAATNRAAGGITGTRCYPLTNGNLTKGNLSASQSFIVSLWANSASITVNGITPSARRSRNGWTYYETTVTGSPTVTIAGSATVDEVRLYPKTAQMTTYTYEPLVGVTTKTDPNNFASYYEYDSFNRPYLVRDDNQNIIKHYEYNYQLR